MDNTKIIEALKKDIGEEKKAVELYTEQLQYTDDKEILDAFNHIIGEEKEHQQIFTDLLKKLQLNPSVLLAAINKAEELGIPYEQFSAVYKAQSNNADERQATDIYLIRHAETPFNDGEQTKIRSIVDLPLDQDGLLQANETGIELKDAGIECIYSSDMTRALQTSRAVQLNTNAQLEIYPGFRSWNLGSLAGMDSKTVEEQILDLVNNENKLPPGSNESYAMFKARNIKAYNDAVQFDGKIAIVTHQSNTIVIQEYLGYQDAIIEPGDWIKIK